MKTISKSIIFLLLVCNTQYSHGQITEEDVIGSWMATLDLGTATMRLGFNISSGSEGQLEATLDSPDQGATGIPMGEVTLWGDSLRIDAPMINGFYLGKVTADSLILGTWNQSNMTFQADLKRLLEKVVVNRPQEPHPPYPYGVEEVAFTNNSEGFSLGGTLTIPEGEGPFPAVILVSGSGSQNRDEEIYGHKPFKLIADHLTRKGIAVLRYDDRGVGASGGSYIGATSASFAGDARSALDFLLDRKEVEKTKVGVIGHSEGGIIAFLLASKYEDIAFIISLAGPGVDGKTILLDQSEYINRLSGVEESILEDNRVVMGRVYDLMSEHESYEAWSKEVIQFVNEFYGEESSGDYTGEEIEQIKQRLMGSIPEPSYAWLRYFVKFDPASYFSSIKCPVFALNGAMDCQVLAEENIRTIREELTATGNQRVTAMILPGLNHLFQNCETGLPGEYGSIEETFDPGTLTLISDWILRNTQ